MITVSCHCSRCSGFMLSHVSLGGIKYSASLLTDTHSGLLSLETQASLQVMTLLKV